MQKTGLILVVFFLNMVTLAAANEKLFVAETFANQVGVVDVSTSTDTTEQIAVGLQPRDLKITPDGKTLYSVNYLSSSLTEINTQTMAVQRTINLSCAPSSFAISPDGVTGYAICRSIAKLLYIDLPTGTETKSLWMTFPYGIAVTPDGVRAYISRSMHSSYVDVVDLTLGKAIARITAGRSPEGIVVAPSGLSVYTANTGSSNVSMIDAATNTIKKTISVGNGPCALAVDSLEKFLYVANKTDSTVSVVDLELGRTVATIPVGLTPKALALANTQPLLYVANFDSNTITVINTQTFQQVATVPVANGPQALAVPAATDTTPPEVSLTLSQEILWPPNHKLIPVTVQVNVADDQDPNPTVQLLNITINEPCSEGNDTLKSKALQSADPNSCRDIAEAAFGTADTSFMLRAERFGYSDDGRIYTITYKVTDAAGNETLASTTVSVH